MRQPPRGERHEVGGRRLMIDRSGTGGPAVVFLPGAGLVGLDYLELHEQAAQLGTSVLYDRGGTGWSDPVELPRGAAAVVDELRDLLRSAAVPAPYLLVGHSLGAFYARRYAQRFPGEVAGLLLLDPGHEDIFRYLPDEAAELNERMKPDLANLPEPTAEQVEAWRGALAQLYERWPEEVRGPLVDHHVTAWRTGVLESANLETEVYDELRDGGPLPDVPMVVFTAMGRNPYWAQFASEDLMRRAHEGISTMHAALAASVPRGEQRTLADAPHQYLHVKHPDEVTGAIRDLLGGQPGPSSDIVVS